MCVCFLWVWVVVSPCVQWLIAFWIYSSAVDIFEYILLQAMNTVTQHEDFGRIFSCSHSGISELKINPE